LGSLQCSSRTLAGFKGLGKGGDKGGEGKRMKKRGGRGEKGRNKNWRSGL